MAFKLFHRNQEPEPVRPTVTRVSDAEIIKGLAAELRTSQECAARWKRHADTYADERDTAVQAFNARVVEAQDLAAAVARVRAIKRSPSRSPYNAFTNAQDDGWDQALDAVHAALDGASTPVTCEPVKDAS